MKTSEIKKGTKVQLANGWKAKTMGSARNTTTVCEVYGFETECGSVYTHDIVGYWDEQGNYKTDLEYSKGQIKCKEMASSMGW